MRRWAAAAFAVMLAAGAMMLARAWLRDVITADGAGVAQRRLAGAEKSATPVERRPVRVVILDGLARAEARGPEMDRICAAGMDLVIDVGFPTKSLPVQSVLWTGLTAQQSGIAMRNQRAAPLPGALPARVPGARAVVEAWPSIARAVGFTPQTSSRPRRDPGRVADGAGVAGWRQLSAAKTPPRLGFIEAAADAVTSDAPLVLIHVLAIDERGHRTGIGAAYRDAVAVSDVVLGGLFERAPDAAWIVLSDHGHVARGGHGDVEDEVRLVRGCVIPRPPGAPARGDVHLVDVSRHLHDTLGVAPSPRAVGRPLAVAATSPDRDATLPRASGLAWLAAIVVWIAGAALTWRWGRPRVAAVAPLVIAAAYLALHGVPSLSWRSPAAALLLGAVTGIACLALPGRGHPARVIAVAVPVVSVALAGAILVGLPSTIAGGPPPRLPQVTAAWQLVLTSSAVPLLVAAGLTGWLLSGRRTSGTRTDASGGSDQRVREPDGL